MYDSTATIGGFLEAAAAKQPTPGGGSIAALAAAMAAAMGEMCVNYSIGKKGLEAHADQLHSALGEFHRARLLLLGLMAEDQAAYESLTAAQKLPKDSPERPQAMAAAVAICSAVPQSVAAAALAVLSLTDRLVDAVNVHLLSDLAVCADLAMAALRCAISNLLVNLPLLTDAQQKSRLEAGAQQMLARATALIQQISPRIWQRVR